MSKAQIERAGVESHEIASTAPSWRSRIKIGTVWVIVLSFGLSLFIEEDAEARRRRKRRRTKQPKVINEKKLYERMGGERALTTLIEDWFRTALQHPEFGPALAPRAKSPTQFAKLRQQFNQELCEISDGPCSEPAESPFEKLSVELKFTEPQQIAFVDLLSQAILQSGVGERERNELLGRLSNVVELNLPEADGPAGERRGGFR